MNIRELLTFHEGRKNKPYKCSAKKSTIGVGWNFDDNPLPKDIAGYLKEHGQITDAMINRLLDISIAHATKDCHDLFPDFDSFSENRQTALLDVMFNMGRGKVSHKFPTFVHNINIGDFQGAADELKYTNGKTKTTLSKYWTDLHGDADGTDDGKKERPETIYEMLVGG